MLQVGATQCYATAQFGVTQRIWQRFQDTGSVEERPKGGRRRKTSLVDDGILSGGRTKTHWDKLGQ